MRKKKDAFSVFSSFREEHPLNPFKREKYKQEHHFKHGTLCSVCCCTAEQTKQHDGTRFCLSSFLVSLLKSKHGRSNRSLRSSPRFICQLMLQVKALVLMSRTRVVHTPNIVLSCTSRVLWRLDLNTWCRALWWHGNALRQTDCDKTEK